MVNIPLRSIFSELSNLLSVVILKNNKINKYLLFIFLFIIIFHIKRYILNFTNVLIITKTQLLFLPLNLIDYYIILTKNNSIIYAIISGIISYYFIYLYHNNSSYLVNYKIDTIIILILICILIYGIKNNIKELIFFAIRDLTYHLLELFFNLYN